MDNINSLIERHANGEFPLQRSEKWYKCRNNMITASEVATILEFNKYKSSYEILLDKVVKTESTSTINTDWGTKFEPIAIEFYETVVSEKVFEIGLVKHVVYKWLGASPDGLLKSGKLLEIKCPISRKIKDEIPFMYWIQMQIQMETCDIDTCDYLECEFYQYNNKEEYLDDEKSECVKKGEYKPLLIDNPEIIYYKLNKFSLKSVNRDRAWFQAIVGQLISFKNNVKKYRYLGINRLKHDERNNLLLNWNNWVSVESIRNYILDDPIIDWLNITYKSNNTHNQLKYFDKPTYSNISFQKHILENYTTFRASIINTLIQKLSTYSDASYTIINDNKNYKQHEKQSNMFNRTESAIRRKISVIFNAVLHDRHAALYGTADVLIRSDFINRLFANAIDAKKIYNKKNKLHYRVFSINNITMDLYTDAKHVKICGNTNIIKSYLYLYNVMLGKIQNYTPCKSYIISNKWKFVKDGINHKGNNLENIGHVNFNKKDKYICAKVPRAIYWVRNMKINHKSWNLFPPSVNELRPNMCNYLDTPYTNIKKIIAEKQHEITHLWKCSIKHRDAALDNKIYNWTTHRNLKVKQLGFDTSKSSNSSNINNSASVIKTLQLIIDYNQLTTKHLDKIIYPEKISSTILEWRDVPVLEFFIDFETILEAIHGASDMIFMSGVGYSINGNFHYKVFILESLDELSERKMLDEMNIFIHDLSAVYNIENPKLWHWSHAEKTFYNKAIQKSTYFKDKTNKLTLWSDLLKLFHTEPIVIRGAINFRLKSIVKAFSNFGFIKSNYTESEISNGLDAMILASDEYTICKNNPSIKIENSSVINNIIKYNRLDCSVLYELLNYLRLNH